MALKKSDLYGSLWRSCDQLRGGMDASQYKDYILTLLFMKYVTDKSKADPDALIDVPDGGSFDDMYAARGDKEIGDKLNKIIARLADANDLRGVIDQADFNDETKLGTGKALQDRLSNLIGIFDSLDFKGSRAEGDDLLGDAYEYLMRNFATESGKSKGQFYTPAEVSRILAAAVGIGEETRQDMTVFDPACGSGSLLLKAADRAPRGMTIYGQEKDNATWALAKMNMILHGNAIADIRKGDSIADPQFTQNSRLRQFDYVVMNPPFSDKAWSTGLDNDYGRFEYGRPPEKNGDYAFLLHALASLKSTGTAAIILPHGVLFRGNAEAAIRRALLKQGYIKAVIGLPANLFYGTGIPACIVVLDKAHATGRTGVFMIDASKDFAKDGAKNRLRDRDIHRTIDTYLNHHEIPRYSRMVPLAEIADEKNDFNLNIPRYIDSSEPEDLQDLDAHLNGGIPNTDLDALGSYWEAFPTLRGTLFADLRPGYSALAVDVNAVQQTILDSDEFTALADKARGVVTDWFAAHRPTLEAIDAQTVPAVLITQLAEDLLERFAPFPLLDEYAAYQQLMAYWHETMHDDVYLIMADGWLDSATPRPAIEDKERGLTETADLEVGSGRAKRKYKTDLVPPSLVIARYLAELKTRADELAVAEADATRDIDEYLEEHAVEDGLLAAAIDDNDKVSKSTVAAALKDIKAGRLVADPDETAALKHAANLYDDQANAKKAVKAVNALLADNVFTKYGELSEDDVKALIFEGKWHAAVAERVAGEIEGMTLSLVSRIRELGDRYGHTVDELNAEIAELEAKVVAHLRAMDVVL